MIRLTSVATKLQFKTSVAVTTNELPIVVSYSDKTSSHYIGGTQTTRSTGSTLIDICSPPQSPSIRDIDTITIFNADTTSKLVYVYFLNSATTYTIISCTLAVGDKLEYIHGNGWKTTDATGATKSTGGGGASITTINTDTTTVQTLTIGTTGTDFAIVDNAAGDHKFNLPTASAVNRGALSSADWTIFNNKLSTIAGIAAGGELSGTYVNPSLVNSAVIGKVLTGYLSGAGVVAATDSILQAIQKLNGNTAALVTGVSSVNALTGAVALTGTAARITISAANVFDIDANYVGQASITTLGTITTGTWNGTVISPVYGGTGIANNVASTLTISGAFATTITVSAITTVTLPTSGTLYGTFAGSITSAQMLSSMSDETGTGLLTFATSPTFTTDITTPLIIGGTAVGSNITYKSTTGVGTAAGIAHQFTGGTNGATVLSTQYNDGQFLVGTTTRNPTALGVVRIGQGTGTIDIGERLSGSGCIWLSAATPSTTNYTLSSTGATTALNSVTTLNLGIGGGVSIGITTASNTYTTGTASTGSNQPHSFTSPPSTNQTLSTEIVGWKYTLTTNRQWATGALATQREFLINAPTYRFVGASTITNAATFAVSGAPIASTNATITNAYALWVQGGLSQFDGNIRLTQTVTTEVVVTDTTVTIVINGTTYKLLAKA